MLRKFGSHVRNLWTGTVAQLPRRDRRLRHPLDEGIVMTPPSTRIRTYLRRHVLGLCALYVALGGTAWGAATIGSTDIKDNAVRTNHIRNGHVRSADVLAGQVQLRISGNCQAGEAIRAVAESGTVTCEPVGGGSGGPPSGPAGGDLTGTYPNPSIAPNAIDTPRLRDLAVTMPKLAVAAVNSAKVADDTLTGADVADTSTLGAAEVNEAGLDSAVLQSRVSGQCAAGQSIRAVAQNGTVTCEVDDAGSSGGPPAGPAGGDLAGTYPNPVLGAGAVAGGTGGEIADNTITAQDLANNSVIGGLGGEVKDDSLTSADVMDGTLGGSDIANDAIENRHVRGDTLVGAHIDESTLRNVQPQGPIPAFGDLSGFYENPVISTGAVDSAKVANGTLTSEDVKNETLEGIDVKADTLTELHIDESTLRDVQPQGPVPLGSDLAGNYPAPSISDGAVHSGKVQNESLTGEDVEDGTLNEDDIQDDGITGGDVADDSLRGADINEASLARSGILPTERHSPVGPATTIDSEFPQQRSVVSLGMAGGSFLVVATGRAELSDRTTNGVVRKANISCEIGPAGGSQFASTLLSTPGVTTQSGAAETTQTLPFTIVGAVTWSTPRTNELRCTSQSPLNGQTAVIRGAELRAIELASATEVAAP